ncbi:cysteine--tRNA ligase [Acidithiobacillus sp. CV18-2]|uniref:Cysteine--tRNA ligase n=1 Tax=Igneacidithiobacillus copahuensis TaxID=2724909 RepID=A0AAE2YNW7_9PROT|nr:cysteine--tRNA ligase [Igneacidithiobacillus copahuensis]MBU2755271.1 cysteine--tRNA ligase [Acidithiobacillus sp. CV18-3]MBU2758373.1 cysteine--tRNA ligase [Acidithiobacillus sp. BN09-2]MBU2778202.1 cysteine--tRNA ligase [Acidithiobacillus sp. CV18-2]MBU2796942.1 cysteine--tRNA ligase [Acidithiobacillus sp. VAN18-2]MBU2799075.1 cysteine--tRNA ligase [Acidithiobacillus sp. VAN18-4]UTV79944.1 cysteine--tRNA ligase [Acidithiobacillus sp. YTS05]
MPKALPVLHLHDSLQREKVVFTPLQSGTASLYVCGMTVYDYCHLGHARAMVTFDTWSRILRYWGLETRYVRNITDVDDKIIHRAAERQEPITALTERFIVAMHEDEAALGCLPPDLEPRATQHIPGMQALIATLIDKGHAYVAENGDVYYAVRSFPGYGKLSGRSLDELQVGARIEPDERKRDPLDFALWKAAKPGEPAWASPWGEGRPGWHIECSAMSTEALGCAFDIHGGGLDLQFPHHENEIAQSQGAGCAFAHYWLHNGHIRVRDEKMSKSLGNFVTVRDLIPIYGGEALRFFILSSHYRSPLQYSDDALAAAQNSLVRLYTTLRGLPPHELVPELGADWEARFVAALADDANTPGALAVLFELAREINRLREQGSELASPLGTLLRHLGGILGLLQQDPERFFQGEDEDADWIEAKLAERQTARVQRNFAHADAIRADLEAAGIVIEDSASGSTWRRR